MVGLGSYTLSPQLDGTVFAYHSKKSLTRSYRSEVDFRHELQKHDWSEMTAAFVTALASISKLQLAGYYSRNAGGAHAAACRMRDIFRDINRQRPPEQGIALNFVTETLPRFANTTNKKENEAIKGACAIIKDYYVRYLSQYETYANSFLTA